MFGDRRVVLVGLDRAVSRDTAVVRQWHRVAEDLATESRSWVAISKASLRSE
jgi:hypothetical protein